MNGSYYNTVLGTPADALYALTEAPCFIYQHSTCLREEIWTILEEARKKRYAICSQISNSPKAEELGLINGHTYSVIGVYSTSLGHVLKIGNPWGSFEWKGDLSEQDLNLRVIEKEIQYKPAEHGTFYMTLDDYYQFFPCSYISNFHDNYHYNYYKLHQSPSSSFIVNSFKLNSDAHVIFTLHQKPKRFTNFLKNYSSGFSYLILVKREGNGYSYVKSLSVMEEKNNLNVGILPSGEYNIISHVHWPYQRKCKYTVSVYSNKDIKLQTVDRNSLSDQYFNSIFDSYFNSFVKHMKKVTEDIEFSMSEISFLTGLRIFKFSNSNHTDNYQISLTLNNFDSNSFILLNAEARMFEGEGKQVLITFPLQANTNYYLILKQISNLPKEKQIQIEDLKWNPLSSPPMNPQYKMMLDIFTKTQMKEKLNLDLYYSFFENADYVYLVFENSGDCLYSYKMQVKLNLKENLSLSKPNDAPKNNLYQFQLNPKNVEWIALKKFDKDKEYDFSFLYSYFKNK
jgi:hypothetical protein